MDPYQRTPINQVPPFDGHNLVTTDAALCTALGAFAGESAPALINSLVDLGETAASSEARQHWHRANTNTPVFRATDRYGQRVDEVDFDPSWHWLMERGIGYGLGGTPWFESDPHAHLRRAAGFIAWGQVEQGHMCPITMTYASIAALKNDEDLYDNWAPGLASTHYDFGLRPRPAKSGLLAGMGMTEKQGGSDLRTNSSLAHDTGDGRTFELSGHKWFTSAPMNDVFLVLAQTASGMTCFVVPRVLDDGTPNPFTIVRLKDKLGNRSNASSEIEFHDTIGFRLGEEGRGIRTIIDMVSATRQDCILGSSAIMRKALNEATWHAAHRSAFGDKLINQPAMMNVLADLAIESEAATLVGLRLAATADRPSDENEQALRRIGLALEKFWVCKRTPMMTAEALECLGGNGYIEESGMPLLYRESPVNSVWEGSGNVNALDVVRAISRSPETLAAWISEVGSVRGEDARLDAAAESVLTELADMSNAEAKARRITARMAAVLQGVQLLKHSSPAVADAFCASRLGRDWDGTFGSLPPTTDFSSIVERATPVTF